MRTFHLSLSVLAVVFAAAASLRADVLKVPKQFASIQAAVTAAGPGDVVEVSKGTYVEAVHVSGKSELTLRARKGHKVIIDGDLAAFPLLVQTSNDVRIERIRVRNSSPTGDGIRVDACQNVTVVGCRVSATEDGIFVYNSSGVHVKNCKLRDVTGDGIVLGHSTFGCLASDNELTDVQSAAIQAYGDSHVIERNTILRAQNGVLLGRWDTADSCTRTIVRDNDIEDTSSGITFGNPGNPQCAAVGNRVTVTTSHGMYIDSVGGVVEGNKIVHAGLQGLVICEADTRVVDNVVKHVAYEGIRVRPAVTGSLFVGNVVLKSGTEGFSVSGSGNCFMRNVAKGSDAVDLVTVPGNVWVDNEFGTIAP